MADEGGAGAAALAGNAGGGTVDPGAGGGGPGAGGGPQWFSGLDSETQGFLQNKGWFGQDLSKADLTKALPEVFKSYRGLEQMNGRDKLVKPKDSADTAAWSEIHKLMGVPGKPEEYGLMPIGADGKADEKADRTYANGMASAFHKAGVGKEAAHALAAEHTKLQNALIEADNTAFKTRSGQELQSLRTEWGQQSDANFASAQRAAHAFGIDGAMMGKMERALGTKTMMGLLARMGGAISEDFKGAGAGAGSGSGMMTPQAANARMSDLRADKEWSKRYDAGDRTAVDEFNRLIRIKAGMGAHAA